MQRLSRCGPGWSRWLHTAAGWYAFDHLDNAGVTSAWEIVPELQDLKVGYVMATDRSGEGFAVEAIDPARSLVLSIRSAEAVTSSALVLEPTIDGRTRLLLRLRLRAGDSPRAGVPGDHGGRARHHDPKDAVQYQGSRRTPRGPRACSRVMGAVCVAPHHPRDRQPLKAGSYSGHCP